MTNSQEDHSALPDVDAVVVGGGVVGVSAALHLLRTGRTVALVEPNEPGANASGHNGGVFNVGECVPTAVPGILRSVPRMILDRDSPLVLSWPHVPRLTPWLTRFALASRRERVEQISIALKTLTDRAVEGYAPIVEGRPAGCLIHEGGLLTGYRTVERFEADAYVHGLRERRGVKFEVLDDEEATRLDPALAGRFQRAVYLPEARFTADPQQFVRTLTEQFCADGGIVVRSTVLEIDAGEHREQRTVVTGRGRFRARTVVLAAGAWSRPLVRRLGLDVPLTTERGYGVLLPRPGVSVARPTIVADLHIAFRTTPTGLQVAGIDELASVSVPPRYWIADRLIRCASMVFPELNTEDATRWMHHRPSLPDSLPIIGSHPWLSGVYLAFGHGHKGLGLGGITGQLIRELVDGENPSVDLAPYSPTRFSRRRRSGVAQAGN